MPGTQHRVLLTAILGLSLALGCLYSVTTPIFEASDELVHYPFVKYLADGRGLPPPVPDPRLNPAQQEATQPPLYYALCAAATFWIDTGPAEQIYQLNPHSEIGRPGATDNRNMVIHTPAEEYPYQGVALAVHLARLLSVVMGTLTVSCTYLIAREAAPGRPYLALGAALVNATVPMFQFIAGSVNNDTLVTLFSSLGLLLLLKTARRSFQSVSPDPSLGWLAAVGAVAGLTALSKLSGLVLLALIGVVLVWLAIRRRSPEKLVLWSLAVGVPFLAVAGWWYLRNWLLFGDPTLLTQHLAIVHGRPTPVTVADILLNESEGLRWSFWGVFGGFNVAASPVVYYLYDVLTLLGLAGLALIPFRSWRGSRVPWTEYESTPDVSRDARQDHSGLGGASWPPVAAIILAGWTLILFVSLVRWSLLTMASQGRLLFPAISAISIGLFAGWQALAPRIDRRIRLATVAIPLTLLAAWMPFRYIAPAYAAPPKLAAGAIKSTFGSDTIDVSYDDKMSLVVVRLSDYRIVPGRPVGVDLYWKTLARMDRDYSVYVKLYDGAGQVVASRDTYPGGGEYATSHLSSGDEFKDTYVLRVSPEAKPGDGHLDVGLYELSSLNRLQAYDGAHRPIPSPNVASFKVYAPESAPGPPDVAADFAFGDRIALGGYSVDASEARPGGVVRGGLYWRATGRPDVDYTVFVHVARPEVPPIAQADSLPQGGAYPTSLWTPGDEVYHPFSVAIPPDAPPGDYDLLVGLYDGKTGARLSVESGLLDRLTGRLRRLVGRPGEPATSVRIGSVRIGSE